MIIMYWRRLLCSVFGHDMLRVYERDRLYLRCTTCEHETAGWRIG